MNPIAQRLLASAERDEPFDLSAIPDSDLNAAARDLSEGPGGATLFVWLCEHAQGDIARAAAIEVVRATQDPGTIVEIVAWLTRGADISPRMRPKLWEAFMARAGAADSHYGVRSHALNGALFLGQGARPLLRRLQASLLEIEPTDDGKYLRHAAKIIGTVLAHDFDEDLKGVLVNLTMVEEAEDEAAMELGLDALRSGLAATDHKSALEAFGAAKDWFERASRVGGARPDAELYRLCVGMLVDFQSRSNGDEVASRIQRIRQSSFEYAAYLSVSDRPPDTKSWIGCSARERVHWTLLGMRLGALDLSLESRVWLKAADVIEHELLAVYAASRSFFQRSREGGVESIVRPSLSGALQRDRLYLDYLDAWITENTGSEWLPDAQAMRREVAAARERSVNRIPHDAATGVPMVVAILERGMIPSKRRAMVLGRIQANVIALVDETTSVVIHERLEHVFGAMQGNSDYRAHEKVRIFFDIIVYYTTLYVASRQNVNTSTLARAKFLFERSPAKVPREKTLQSDYHEFLMGSPLASVCTAEVRDVGGGRVDILFSHEWIKTVAELKRVKIDCDQAGLVDRYGAQAMSYQATNVTLGILLVLDLFERGGGQPHLREQISVHRKLPAGGSLTEYWVVLFRLQGRRKKPSDL